MGHKDNSIYILYTCTLNPVESNHRDITRYNKTFIFVLSKWRRVRIEVSGPHPDPFSMKIMIFVYPAKHCTQVIMYNYTECLCNYSQIKGGGRIT